MRRPRARTVPVVTEQRMIFVFEIRIRAGYSAERYAAAWVEASEIIQSAPGARGTRLHRKIGDPDRLLAIASWEDKAARDAAEDRRDERVQAIIDTQARWVEIKVIGEFEEPEWVVWPTLQSAP
jgi:heme-degrading monooxygenase HmoA